MFFFSKLITGKLTRKILSLRGAEITRLLIDLRRHMNKEFIILR